MFPTGRQRRHFTSSLDDRSFSPTFEQDVKTNLQLLSLLEAIEPVDDAQTPLYKPSFETNALSELDIALTRMLSLKSQISTASSDTQMHAAAVSDRGDDTFVKIGAGACGIVFAPDGQSIAVKLAKNGYAADLRNDFRMHSRLVKNFDKYGADEHINIPEVCAFIVKEDCRYFEAYPGLVKAAEQICDIPTEILVSERILPLPKAIRTKLIDKFCAPRIKDQALKDVANKDCLVRVYLGSSNGRSEARFFSLRNFKLHLNQMVDLQLDIEAFAHSIATAYAIMHWAAQVDARDVEFVLGSCTKRASRSFPFATEVWDSKLETSIAPDSLRNEDFLSRRTELFVLDFNQVRPITMDAAGVAQAIEAVLINDPYVPKPLQESVAEKQVWNTFVTTYLTTSDNILKGEKADESLFALPRQFIRGLVDKQQEKENMKASRSE